MKKILVPVDFSNGSLNALEYAAHLAGKTNSTLYAVNIYMEAAHYLIAEPAAITVPYFSTGVLYEQVQKTVDKKLQQLRTKKFMKNIRFVPKSIIGASIHTEIVSYAEKIKADLIVMGSHGTGEVNILPGSTAERVVRFSQVPVFMVTGKIKDPDFKKIIFASDFGKESYDVFPTVQSFANITSAAITLLKINTPEKFSRTSDNIEKINKFNKHFKKNYPAVVYDDFGQEEGIINYSDEAGADVISIGTHGKKGLARFFSSDVSEGMVRLTHRPVLVVNFKKK
jgi:nucleotide-binding universal stress UspA family protein